MSTGEFDSRSSEALALAAGDGSGPPHVPAASTRRDVTLRPSSMNRTIRVSMTRPLAVLLNLCLLFLAIPLRAGSTDQDCLKCHGMKAGKSGAPFVELAQFTASIHGGNGCVSCHSDLDGAKHPGGTAPKPVACGSCHDTAEATFNASVHGQARKAGNTGAAGCVECHGSHGIKPFAASDSPVNRANEGATCGACHSDIQKDFQDSIHGQAMAKGFNEAPTCTDCHGDHRIQSLKQASSVKHGRAGLHPLPRFPAHEREVQPPGQPGLHLPGQLPRTGRPHGRQDHGQLRQLPRLPQDPAEHGQALHRPPGQPRPDLRQVPSRRHGELRPGQDPLGWQRCLRLRRQDQQLGAERLPSADLRHHRRHGRPQPADSLPQGHGRPAQPGARRGAHEAPGPPPARPAGHQLHLPGDQRLRPEVPGLLAELPGGLQRELPPHRPPHLRGRDDGPLRGSCVLCLGHQGWPPVRARTCSPRSRTCWMYWPTCATS